MIGAKNRDQNFGFEDVAFTNSREGDLLSALFTAKEMNDVDMFQKTLHEYNRITPLKYEETQILVHIKDTSGVLGNGLNLAGNDETGDKEPDFT